MDKKNIFKLVSTYISIILGAGFISGKELYFFFGRYNKFGLITLTFVSILFSLLLYKQLNIIKNNDICNYNEFSSIIMKKHFHILTENVTLLFLFVMISTMISAFCSTITQSFNLNQYVPSVFIFLLTLYFLVKGVDNIIVLNSVLTPIMIIGILIIGVYLTDLRSVAVFNDITTTSNNYINATILALFYVSFNSLTTVPMISNVKQMLDSKLTILLSSIISGAILLALGLNILFPLIEHKNILQNSDIPILALLQERNLLAEYIYLIVLLLAIFSTLISTSISFISTAEKKLNIKNNSIVFKALVLLLALFFSRFGFSNFISIVYPIFGFLGLIQIYYILRN